MRKITLTALATLVTLPVAISPALAHTKWSKVKTPFGWTWGPPMIMHVHESSGSPSGSTVGGCARSSYTPVRTYTWTVHNKQNRTQYFYIDGAKNYISPNSSKHFTSKIGGVSETCKGTTVSHPRPKITFDRYFDPASNNNPFTGKTFSVVADSHSVFYFWNEREGFDAMNTVKFTVESSSRR